MQTLREALSQPGAVLLDTVRAGSEDRDSLLFTAPQRILEARTLDAVPGLLEALDAAVGEGAYVAGYLAYEAGYAFEAVVPEGRMPVSDRWPLAWFGVYAAPEVLPPSVLTPRPSDGGVPSGEEAALPEHVRFSLEREAYLKNIAAIKAHIHAGDVYQINYTGAVTFDYDGPPFLLYQGLRRRQRVAYGAFLNLDAHRQVLSCSPELFFRRQGDRMVTRPMKGTVRRGRTYDEDEQLRAWLACDEKSRAENLMIVDLLRNDLSRCCVPGSVRVPALFTTERYETLFQMTSTVEGRLQEGIRYADLFRALFPCGSVTGAPKVRAMQIIHALEAHPRGPYCGAIGFIAPDRRAVFSVAIRTLTLDEGRGAMGTGSGIVWDSDPGDEYEECLLKARFLTDMQVPPAARRDFSLIETMRYDGGLPLLDLHLARLQASALYFGFEYDDAAVRALIQERTARLGPGDRCKVRLLLAHDGRATLTMDALHEAVPREPVRLMRATPRVDPSDVFFYHKTTHRRLYEETYQAARQAGFDEAYFCNDRGEVTEGSRTNLFIRQGDRLLTPPISSGLLAGVYRQHLLATRPEASEQILYEDDLRTATAVYVCNAVWGLREAMLVDAEATHSR